VNPLSSSFYYTTPLATDFPAPTASSSFLLTRKHSLSQLPTPKTELRFLSFSSLANYRGFTRS
jgi:hypothetical protein